ncbi:hypothetical protein ACFQ9X_07375 [Catenulispora yoronensis]
MTWDEMAPQARDFFTGLRTPGIGEQMILEDNMFIERNLPALIPGIDAADLAAYREPFPDPRSRRPMLAWAREFPLGGEPPTSSRGWRRTAPGCGSPRTCPSC